MATLGYNIVILKGSTAIAAVKSNDLQVGGDTIEKSSATDSEWTHVVPGRKSWSINVSYLLLDSSVLGISGGTGVRDVLQVNNSFTLHIKKRGANNSAGVTGTAVLTMCRISAIQGNLATGTFTFTGDGPLT